MEDRNPFRGLATIELFDGVRIGSGRGVGTHNYRTPREHGIVSGWRHGQRLTGFL